MTKQFFFNGVNGSTGEYLLPPMSASELSSIARGEELDPGHLRELEHRFRSATEAHFGPEEGVDVKDLAQSGWGIVFAYDATPGADELREALSDLLELRREQAGGLYREFLGADAYRPGESKGEFLSRHKVGPGPAVPKKVPYYLLLVGSPEEIPFQVQYQLDVQYAVGRLHFATLEEYAQYSRSVVLAERGEAALPRRTAFFGVQTPNDHATKLSATRLVTPLAQAVEEERSDKEWTVTNEADPSKIRLGALLGGDETPALLFTASHGVGFDRGDTRQFAHQGGLICQDWPGPRAWQGRGPLVEDHYFSRDDLDDAKPLGLIAFFFACYGAGTPRLDDFAHQALRKPVALAPHPFVAGLPQRLLGHPNGGALAVIGHVDRAWGCSFDWGRAGPQLAVFESSIRRLHDAHTVGSALEFFDERYSELSTSLTEALDDVRKGKQPDDLALARMWTANNDARSYVILGDPAVRLAARAVGSAESRPSLGKIEICSTAQREESSSIRPTLEGFCRQLAGTLSAARERAPEGAHISIRAVVPVGTSTDLPMARDTQGVEVTMEVGHPGPTTRPVPPVAPTPESTEATVGEPLRVDPLTAFKASVRQEVESSSGVDYFNSGEHIWLGQKGFVQACDDAGISRDEYGRSFALISRRAGDESFTYGELVALSGDFYGSPDDLWNEKPARLPWLYECNDISDLRRIFADELDAIEQQQRGLKVGYPDNNIAMAWNAKSYIELALDNTAHFGWHSMVTYCRYHDEALRLAAQSARQKGDGRDRTLRQALFYNAYADHFLTDSFAAGHIRCPREQIRQWAKEQGYSEKLAGALSKLLHDQDGHINSFHGPNEEARPADDGLWVTNALGTEWHTRCDGQLFLVPDASKERSAVIEQPVEAVQASVTELIKACRSATMPAGTFGATRHVPFPHPKGQMLSQKFPADIPREDLDKLMDSIKWYMKIPWISAGVERDAVLALFDALPDLMKRSREDVASDLARDPSLRERLAPEYVDAFRAIA